MVGMQVLVGGRRRLCAPEYQGHRPDCYQVDAAAERCVNVLLDLIATRVSYVRAGGGCRDESTCVFFPPDFLVILPCFTHIVWGLGYIPRYPSTYERRQFRYCVRNLEESWMSRGEGIASLDLRVRERSTMGRVAILPWTRSQRSRILLPISPRLSIVNFRLNCLAIATADTDAVVKLFLYEARHVTRSRAARSNTATKDYPNPQTM